MNWSIFHGIKITIIVINHIGENTGYLNVNVKKKYRFSIFNI